MAGLYMFDGAKPFPHLWTMMLQYKISTNCNPIEKALDHQIETKQKYKARTKTQKTQSTYLRVLMQ